MEKNAGKKIIDIEFNDVLDHLIEKGVFTKDFADILVALDHDLGNAEQSLLAVFDNLCEGVIDVNIDTTALKIVKTKLQQWITLLEPNN